MNNATIGFRGAPFWAWNGKLEIDELKRQVRAMKEMGLGGFFIHSRVGLATEYLGADWFACVRAVIAEAKKCDLKVWLYDEDRWPSGACGGMVTADDRFKARYLFCERRSRSTGFAAPADAQMLGWYAAEFSGATLTGYRRLSAPPEADGTGEALCVAWRLEAQSPWFNGETYLDTLNPAATACFIARTHERYDAEIGAEFGETVPGVFCDEPCYHDGADPALLPWTDALEERFSARYGVDLLDTLPELFYETAAPVSVTRYRYYQLVTELFIHSFLRPLGEWCAKHRLIFTGHLLREDTLADQRLSVGAAMRGYEFMQMPGIDLLTEHWNIFNTTLQLRSAARQFGKKRCLSEIYGCTGWDFPLAGHKALGDWQYALGVNFRCQHLNWYSMAAEAKRDYPASIGPQSPWFDRYAVVEDYFAALGEELTAGTALPELLVIHPIESAWSVAWGGAELQKLDLEFSTLTNRLLGEHWDFDFGDEAILAGHGGVDGATLRVGAVHYRAVLLPRLLTIRATTLALLTQFAAAGGAVYAPFGTPDCVDGQRSDAGTEAAAGFIPAFPEAARRAVTLTATPDGAELAPLLSNLTRRDDGYALFLVNLGMTPEAQCQAAPQIADRRMTFPKVFVKLRVAENGALYEKILPSGELRRCPYSCDDGGYGFETSLGERESRLFIITTEAVNAAPPPTTATGFTEPVALDAFGAYRTDEPNVLVLDHVSARINGAAMADDLYVLTLDDRLREKLGVPPRGAAMVQPWKQPRRDDGAALMLEISARFECAELPTTELALVTEDAGRARFSVNGTPLPPQPRGYWCDPALVKLALAPEMLRVGTNVITVTQRYSAAHPGLESLFLLGDFGVCEQTLIARPARLRAGDWTHQGLPNYAGNLTYEMTFAMPSAAPVRLRIPAWRGAALGVRLNDGAETMLAWPPAECTLVACAGVNRLAITVYGHRRNALGPFYCAKRPAWVGSHEFKCEERPSRQLVELGLLREPGLFAELCAFSRK